MPIQSCKLRASRRGAIAVLVVAVIGVMMVLAAFAVNVAYMQLVREQLRVACDSAAKAALVNLGATQSESTAISFAQTVSNYNLVAGKPPQIPTTNIVFGNAMPDGSGTYEFTPGLKPFNAAKVTGNVTRGLFMQTFLPVSDFSTTQVSLTTRISHDVCLVLDRSASMAFDLSNSEFSYPADVARGKNPMQIYFTRPSPTASRWRALSDAVNTFISTLQSRNLDVRVGLATYAEDYSFGNFGGKRATLDVPMTSSLKQISAGMNGRGQLPLVGDTNIEAGLAQAAQELTGPHARTTANRTIVLLTDGVPTSGNADIPSLTLNNRQSLQIVTHVITFGGQAAGGAYQTLMMNAAINGNGKFYNAPTAAQLQEAFQSIADSLPAVLIK